MLLVLFLLPLLWGFVSLLRGAASYGAPQCPGLQLGKDGEEHPGSMRPGFTCHVNYNDRSGSGQSTATRTYKQQKYAQVQDRIDHFERGILHTAYGAAGLTIIAAAHGPYRLPWRREGRRSEHRTKVS